MASFNKIILVGYLGKDPELRYTPDSTPVCNFSMATTQRKKDRTGEYQDLTTWFNVTLWRKQAENAAQYLFKGSAVYIEGQLSMRPYQDRDGNTRYSLDVMGSDMHFIGKKADNGDSGQTERPRQREAAATSTRGGDEQPPVTEDDIPF